MFGCIFFYLLFLCLHGPESSKLPGCKNLLITLTIGTQRFSKARFKYKIVHLSTILNPSQSLKRYPTMAQPKRLKK